MGSIPSARAPSRRPRFTTSSPANSPTSRPTPKSAQRCINRRSIFSPRPPSTGPRSRSCAPTSSRGSTPNPKPLSASFSTSPTSSRRRNAPSFPPISKRWRGAERWADGAAGATARQWATAPTAARTRISKPSPPVRLWPRPPTAAITFSCASVGHPGKTCLELKSIMAERLLIIDDDSRLAAMVSDYLGKAGFLVDCRFTGRDGLAALDHAAFDAVILDVMLPDLDGFEVCRRIRTRAATPILMLTARGEETDRIVGLEIGADDYLPKPFNPRELQARLRAIMRRGRAFAPASGALRFGRLEIDRDSRAVRLDGEAKILTSHQFDLLVALAENAGRVLNRQRLMDLVKGEELEAFDRSIDVHISRIRSAIEDDPKHPRRILTVRGAGYVFAKKQDDEP